LNLAKIYLQANDKASARTELEGLKQHAHKSLPSLK